MLLQNGAAMVIPGGVAECTEIQHGMETILLRRRLGFVRIALQHGALLPAGAKMLSTVQNQAQASLLHCADKHHGC